METNAERDARFGSGNDIIWGAGNWIRCPICPHDDVGREVYHHKRKHEVYKMNVPTHGWTHLGKPVHGSTHDHLPATTGYQRFNKKVALGLSRYIMTMTAFWVFCVLACCSLPAILNEFSAFKGIFPSWMVSASLIALIAWVSSNFLQLVFLPALGVGQNLQSAAADARAAKMFEDAEYIKDQVNEHTDGGLKAVMDSLAEIKTLLRSPPDGGTSVREPRKPRPQRPSESARRAQPT